MRKVLALVKKTERKILQQKKCVEYPVHFYDAYMNKPDTHAFLIGKFNYVQNANRQ